MVIDDSYYMRLALNEAWKYQGITYPNPPVGALLLDKHDRILSIEAHKKAGLAHAEVEALKSGFLKLNSNTHLNNTLQQINSPSDIHNFLKENHNSYFKECTMYVTLEPCNHYGKTPPCATLLSEVGVKKVFIGSLDQGKEAGGGEKILKSSNIKTVTGVLKDECDDLLEPFNIWSKKNFVLFKHAQSINGVIDGGYISCDKALDFVHRLREKIDLIVIGGNTARIDRPTLDARRVDGTPPDVLVYTKKGNFDMTIPLFSVKNRKVHIADNLKILERYKFIMIEGGGDMFEAIKDITDWHIAILSPKYKEGKVFTAKCEEKILHTQAIGSDILVWSKIA